MNITVIGRGNIGGGLADLWKRAKPNALSGSSVSTPGTTRSAWAA
ncbi:hypothetical protein ACFW95_00235 [Streptomyces sp. NPDC059474]